MLCLDLLSIYAGTKSSYRISCYNYPLLALSFNRHVRFSRDKRDKNHKAMQETGRLILCLYIALSAWALSHDACWHHSCTCSVSPFLSLLVISPVAEQVTAECSATFLGRPWCPAVTATASLWAQHVTLHLLASLSVILPGMLTSMMQLLMTHIWSLHKCWFNMNEIWAAILWEVWKLRQPHRLRSSAITPGKAWKGKLIEMTQHNVNETHKQKSSTAWTFGLRALVWPLRLWGTNWILTSATGLCSWRNWSNINCPSMQEPALENWWTGPAASHILWTIDNVIVLALLYKKTISV